MERSTVSRRRFLGMAVGAGAAVGLTGGPALASSGWSRRRRFASPFTLGVASGDPLPDGAVLWTRLAPHPMEGGGMPSSDVEVAWQVATDERLARVVRQGTAIARSGLAHSVHVDVRGLQPGRWYWYRFRAGGHVSPVGRVRTAPAFGSSPDQLRFAFASCQDFELGYYPAWGRMAQEDLDLVVFLGDYIYEGPPLGGGVRLHNGPEPMDLVGYRNRLALYKGDPQLQAAHASFPFLVTWDDHEVEDNYADEDNTQGLSRAAFLRRRAAAYQAYWEHQPLRGAPPSGPNYRLYRASAFGDLARFTVLDTRQYRSPQPCGSDADIADRCAGAFDPHATMTGEAQERWLQGQLRRSPARWNVIAQQTVMSEWDFSSGPGTLFDVDAWDGYVAARRRLLSFLDRERPRNPVVVSGDIHASLVGDLKADFADPGSRTVGTEFVGTSISSALPEGFVQFLERGAREEPHLKYFEGRRRGYARCTLDRAHWRTDYRYVTTTSDPRAAVRTGASFVVEDGRPGAVLA